MININRSQSLDDSISRLIAAYQQAMQEGDRSDFLTKAEVIRSVIDSGRAVATRLRTRVQGTDQLVRKLENYYQALHAEDWVEKSKSAVTTAAAIIGVTSGTMAGLALDAVGAIFEGSFTAGSNFLRYIIAYPTVFYFLLQALRQAYDEYSKNEQNPSPSMARSILSRTVDPAEQQVYDLIGGNRPVRTFERINQSGAIAVGVLVFVVACGFLFGVLQSF